MRPGVRLAESSTYMYNRKIQKNQIKTSNSRPLSPISLHPLHFSIWICEIYFSRATTRIVPPAPKKRKISPRLSLLFSLFGIDAYRPYLGLRTTVYGLRSLCHPVLSLLSTPPALLLPYPSLFTVAQPVLYAAVTLWVLWVHSGQFYRESIQIQVGQPHSDGARMGSTNKQGRGPVLHCGAFPVRDSD